MLFFLARPFEGERKDGVVADRYNQIAKKIAAALNKKFPWAIIFDPYYVYLDSRIDPENPATFLYDKKDPEGFKRGQQACRRTTEIAGAADILIAILPEVSMGSAVEIYEAHRHGRYIVIIGNDNWAVYVFHHRYYHTPEEFIQEIESGVFEKQLVDNGVWVPHPWLHLNQ